MKVNLKGVFANQFCNMPEWSEPLPISEMMSPADNPVGALFERYQTSGAPMPEIEVPSIMLHIFTFNSHSGEL